MRGRCCWTVGWSLTTGSTVPMHSSGSEVNKSTPLFIFAGFGGGYMEREQVEYVEKVVSDSEYDEVCVFCLSFVPCLCEGAEY